MTTSTLPSGLRIQTIGKRRQRIHYYRQWVLPDGTKEWGQTALLPSDTEGKAYYLAKGFRLDPPEGTEFSLTNTAEKIRKENEALKAEAEILVAKAERDSLYAEIASLKAKLEDKGKQEDSRKVGRPPKTGG